MTVQNDDYILTGERVAEDSPDRCQGITKYGQCQFRKVPGSTFCSKHGGNSVIEKQKKESLNNYKLTKFKGRLCELSQNPNIKTLRDEVAILRMTLEERLNSLDGPADLIIHSHVISELVIKINTLVTSCHKLESSMGLMLDKQAILQFGSEVVGIIGDEISDPAMLDRVANRIMALYGDLGNDPTAG